MSCLLSPPPEAHPRSRGEHGSFPIITPTLVGSSPLARGALALHDQPPAREGLIPARAGSTAWTLRWSAVAWAHPRSRGEHRGLGGGHGLTPGSSPLARGALPPMAGIERPDRLIPARAGSTRPCRQPGRRTRAHPRSRGEHRMSSDVATNVWGSSPLARGALGAGDAPERVARLIPARAGSTSDHPPECWAGWAHPRSRGEHQRASSVSTSARGSSPLARGARLQRRELSALRRLIPARAGSTSTSSRTPRSWWAHPRSRGEHPDGKPAKLTPAGSSPLARGALDHGAGEGGGLGLIPARAGSTRCGACRDRTRRAHPRSRGEHGLAGGADLGDGGSSPLARGARA